MRDGGGVPARGDLAGRLRRARDRSFVGRDGERELVAAALDGEAAGFALLFLHGPGGIGKSALLRRIATDAEAVGAVTVAVDGREVAPSPSEFTAAIARELGLPPGADPVPVLHDGPRPVLLVDTFEHCAGVQGWLREDFLPRLPADALTVVAGREPPDEAWRLDPGWHELVRVVALRNLPPADAAALLAARGVPAELHDRVLAFAGGHPLALCVVAEMLAQRGADATLLDPGAPDVVRALLGRFVDEVPSARHRVALEVCAHARVTTESLLRATLDDPDADELFEWLRARSFVEEGVEGLYPHDLARDVLDADLRWRDPERYTDLHRRIRGHIAGRSRAGGVEDRVRARWDAMFLHRRNPVFAPFFTWRVETSEYDDDLRPADHAAVHAMTAAAEGEESAAILEFWIRRQPPAIRVYRRPGQDEPAGFSVWLRLVEPAPEELAVDPVVAAAWAHARRVGPPRGGEELGILRTFVVPGAYHRPSAVMDLIQIRCVLEWTGDPAPALSFLAIAEAEFWAPQMAYIDHHRAGEAAVGARTFTLFAHDWRATPMSAWSAMLAERELGGGPGPSPGPRLPPPRVVLSAVEFEAAVKDALRAWRHPDALARNPLCRSRVVADACDGGEPAQILADLLVEATDTLAAHPRDVKLHRAVAATFFRNTPTQEAAAERLGLPFSTYRRHLAAGVTRVVGWLWERELHGPGASSG